MHCGLFFLEARRCFSARPIRVLLPQPVRAAKFPQLERDTRRILKPGPILGPAKSAEDLSLYRELLFNSGSASDAWRNLSETYRPQSVSWGSWPSRSASSTASPTRILPPLITQQSSASLPSKHSWIF